MQMLIPIRQPCHMTNVTTVEMQVKQNSNDAQTLTTTRTMATNIPFDDQYIRVAITNISRALP